MPKKNYKMRLEEKIRGMVVHTHYCLQTGNFGGIVIFFFIVFLLLQDIQFTS